MHIYLCVYICASVSSCKYADLVFGVTKAGGNVSQTGLLHPILNYL